MSCSTITIAVPSARMRRQRRVDVADDDRRQAEADLVAEQQPRVGHQRPADRHHLLLAAGQCRGAGCGGARSSIGKQLVDALQRPRPGGRRAIGADQRGSPRRVSDGNSRRPSGTIAMPRATISAAGSAPIGWPSKHDLVGPAGKQAGDRPQQRDLAGAVGADDRDRLALLEREVDAEQRLEVAVEGGRARASASSGIRPRCPR